MGQRQRAGMAAMTRLGDGMLVLIWLGGEIDSIASASYDTGLLGCPTR
jgi:hypothetical protein